MSAESEAEFIEFLNIISLYRSKHVNKSRKHKWCEACRIDIPIGTPSYTITYIENRPMDFTICPDCYTKYRGVLI